MSCAAELASVYGETCVWRTSAAPYLWKDDNGLGDRITVALSMVPSGSGRASGTTRSR